MQRLIILTATKAEAAALINHFKLLKDEKRKNTYYNKAITLVVTGVGMKSACDAVELFLKEYPEAMNIINIGIAGAKALEIGTLIWPQRVGDTLVNVGLPAQQTSTMQVHSSNKPEQPTEFNVIYDMEAQGINQALVANSSYAQLFCAKVISDNERHSHTQISAQHATDMIRCHLVQFENLFDILLQSATKN